ncbi:hypothetical protein [Agrococcus carbonis]|uniref:hypothetical protein n=1 Tax=Agrococcus carbonis TaxID=684552 RepID=UPI000B85AEF4|nr:hypothetical protein [Agrococcus carbonis]
MVIDAQAVSGVVTAGDNGLSDDRLDVQATTAEELSQIRAELEAALEREETLEREEALERQERAGQAAATVPQATVPELRAPRRRSP